MELKYSIVAGYSSESQLVHTIFMAHWLCYINRIPFDTDRWQRRNNYFRMQCCLISIVNSKIYSKNHFSKYRETKKKTKRNTAQ